MAIIPGIYASQISGHLITSNFFLISQVTPSGVGTVTFSSIPSTYKSLQIRFNLITSSNLDYGLQFNGDTGTNYAIHGLWGNGNTAQVVSGTSLTYIELNVHGTISTVYPNVGILDVIDYANANKNKTIKLLTGVNNNTSAGTMEIDSGVWLSTAAVTSLTFSTLGGTYTGTISLYGVS